MHEMALVSDVLDVALRHAETVGANQITKINLTIGMGRDIVEGLIDGMFSYLARDTIACGAQLVIRRPPFMVRCADCSAVYHLDSRDRSTFPCPRCGKDEGFSLVSGMEFKIDSIEAKGLAEVGAAARC